jgi:hypothetical protein
LFIARADISSQHVISTMDTSTHSSVIGSFGEGRLANQENILSLFLSINMSVDLCFCLSVLLSIYVTVYLFFCPSMFLSIYVFIYLCICPSMFLSIYVFVYLFYVNQSFCLSMFLSIYFSIHLCFCPSMFLSIYVSCLPTILYIDKISQNHYCLLWNTVHETSLTPPPPPPHTQKIRNWVRYYTILFKFLSRNRIFWPLQFLKIFYLTFII